MIVLIGILIGIAAAFFALLAVFYALGIIKKEFQVTPPKPGIKPISKDSLKKALLKLNKNRIFNISEAKDTDLVINWEIVDKKWIEVLGKAWLNKNYYAWLLLDDKNKMVKYSEMITEKSFTSGAAGIHSNTSFFRGIQLWHKERSYRFGIRNDFTIGEIYNYKFSPNEVKNVIRQIANDNGWGFGLVATKKQLSYNN